MRTANRIASVILFCGTLLVACAPAVAGSGVIGSVAGSVNASLGDVPAIPHSTVFSGDTLKITDDGGAVVSTLKGTRLTFRSDAVATFSKAPGAVSVQLERGDVAVNRPSLGDPIQVRAGDVTVTTPEGFASLGDVAMNADSIVISATEGSLNVVSGSAAPVKVEKGKTITINTKNARAPQGGGSTGVGTSINRDHVLEIVAAGAGIFGMIWAIKNQSDINNLQNQICDLNHNISPYKPVGPCQ